MQNAKITAAPAITCDRRTKLLGVAAAAAFTLLALGIRCVDLGVQSFWRDEATSAFWAKMSLPELLGHLRQDVHAPLYYVLLGGWVRVFGESEAAFRSFGAILGGLTPLVLYWALVRPAGPIAAALAAFALAVLPGHVLFSQQVGVYALLVLLVVLGLGLFCRAADDAGRDRAVESPGRKWAREIRIASMLGLTLAALVYTHMWGLLVWAALGTAAGALALLGRGRNPGQSPIALRYALAQGIAITLWLPWLLPALHQAGSRTMDHLPPTPLPWDMLYGSYFCWFVNPISLWLAVGLSIAFLFAAARSFRRTPAAAEGRALTVVLLCVLVVPHVLCMLAAPWKTLYYPRYTLVCVPAVAAMVGIVISWVPTYAGKLLAAALTAAPLLYPTWKAGLCIAATVFGPSELREAARLVAAEGRPGDVIVLFPEIYAPTFNWYYRGDLPQVCFPTTGRVETVSYATYADRMEDAASARRAADYVRMNLKPGGRLWVFYNATYRGQLSRINYDDALVRFLGELDQQIPTRKDVRPFASPAAAGQGGIRAQQREPVQLTICMPVSDAASPKR